MKKLILFLIGIAAMVSGCTSEDGNMLVQERECMDKLITTSRFRSESDARQKHSKLLLRLVAEDGPALHSRLAMESQLFARQARVPERTIL